MTDQLSNDEFFQYTPGIHEPTWIPVAKKVQVKLKHVTIADSQRVMLKREFPMAYFFPQEDVQIQFLEESHQSSKSDAWGNPLYMHVKTGSKVAEHAAWSYKKPTDHAPSDIEGYIAFEWDAMDLWMEEDEEVRVHPRDPYHRIDVCHSSRHVRIVISGETIAETRCPVILFETGLPARFYIRKTDVRLDLLEPTAHQTECPYKGTASYYSIKTDEHKMENVVWTYPFPNAEMNKIKDLVAFYAEKIDDVFIDGKKLTK